MPTDHLYPFQWNWDSAFCAMGIATFDIDRAWAELESLYLGQWSNGLLPHIVFHDVVDSYYPGPEVWGANHSPQTSGISQPPVTATSARFILDRAKGDERSEARAAALYPKILALHDWWARERDPDGTGLVGVLHPWESGADNSPVWDGPLNGTPATQTVFNRRDVALVDATMRPRQWEYERYIYLVELYRSLGWDGPRMWAQTPFKVADVGLNAILMRDEHDLRFLATRFGTEAERRRLSARAAQRQKGLETLWDAKAGAYYSRDLVSGEPIPIASHAGFLPLWGGLDSPDRVARLAAELRRWLDLCQFGAPTMAPDSPEFDQRRYWRGPVWAIVNWMIGDGLARHGVDDLAQRLRDDTRRLMEQAGFCEYYDPLTGEGLGGGVFSWTAAVGLAWALA
ncbi:MGH1-like glycoside hydrolase domain-containing protein [Phenylobacterium hankyongense]|uniref:MGH1-like glycoside hydrolase domain-containing protein n=1 Tax=Phenylobacterium hankyongense TaxID=1813876 RepID=UPI001A9FC7CD|nr:trehalase family glycosidase [Phenylobacterium hankyongense]